MFNIRDPTVVIPFFYLNRTWKEFFQQAHFSVSQN